MPGADIHRTFQTVMRAIAQDSKAITDFIHGEVDLIAAAQERDFSERRARKCKG